MNYIQIPEGIYNNIIYLLQRGCDVCSNVDYSSDAEPERSSSYANGYSRATMKDVIVQLDLYKQVVN